MSYTFFYKHKHIFSANFLTSDVDLYSLAYFGILDLSGEDIEVKNLFTDDEWNEMIEDFNNNVNLSDLEVEQEKPIYELMDKITKVGNLLFIFHVMYQINRP